MAIKIRYRTTRYACETSCPFTDPKKRGVCVRVGSWACECCEFHVAKDRKYNIVVCNHPGTPIFCKKDRALNKDVSI